MSGPWVSRADICRTLAAMHAAAPLVHCLTATVSMSLVADGLLAAGARPMMTETEAEAPTLVRSADALLINLGTLSTDGVVGIPATVAAAREHGVPWVLDPTAVGVAPVRTPLARRLLAEGPAVVRGNASEIRVLAETGGGGRGPDATEDVASDEAEALARAHSTVVAVSGPVDLVTDGSRAAHLEGGAVMLTQVTSTGCLLGALTAACLSVSEGHVAAVSAAALLAVAAEQAAVQGDAPGSFRWALVDELHRVGPERVAEQVRLT